MKTESDSHCCGICKISLLSLPDFLIHKLQHVGHGKGLGCELCGLGYNRIAPLQDHYRRKHGLEIFSKNQMAKILSQPSKNVTETTSSAAVSSPLDVPPTSTTSPALKHLLSSPYVTSNNSTSSASVPENIVIEEKLPSASRNLQSAKDKLDAVQLGCSTNLTKMAPAESSMKMPLSNLTSSRCLVTSNMISVENNIDLDSQEINLSSAELMSAETEQLSFDNQSSVNIHLSSPADPNIPSEGQLSDLVTSDIMFSSHSVDGDVPNLISNRLTSPNHNNVVGKTLLESSHKMPPAKTVHVIIAKTEGEGISVEDNKCSDVDQNPLEVESIKDEGAEPGLQTADESSKCFQNETKDSDSSCGMDTKGKTNMAAKHKNGENFKPDFHFILLANLVKGRSLNYRRNQFKCLHCDFKTTWINSLIKHMKMFHEDMMSIHQNIEVKSVDTSPERKLVKMSAYLAELNSLKKPTRKKRQVEKQDRLGEFQCKMCSKVFNRLRYLRKHMQVHRTEKKHLCDECGKSFKTRSYLLSHHRVHKTKEYQCSQCDFRSSINAVIHAHRQLHHEGSVLCDICGFAYNDKSTLKKHKLVHDPSRPFPCSYPGCTWRFKSKVMCLAHVKAHTSEGKFQCSLCSYVFRQNHHLQRHTATVHGINKNSVKGKVKKPDQTEEQTDSDTNSVRLILDYSQMEVDNFPSMLQSGQLVIATDSEGNTVNYEVADITMNVALMSQDDENQSADNRAVMIPNYDTGQIVLQGSEMT